MATINRKEIRRRIHARIRRKVRGTAERPRLAVHFSNKNVYAQIINDDSRVTVVQASTKEKGAEAGKSNVATAQKIGAAIAERAQAQGITTVVFYPGGLK